MIERLRQYSRYLSEILIHKEILTLFPRVNVGEHLAYEKPKKKEKRLRFHLERNLNNYGMSKHAILKLYAQVEQDFIKLYQELEENPELSGIEELVGYTNFMAQTGKKFGFESKEIIDDPILCRLFDLRIEKPSLSGMETAESIKEFSITKEDFAVRFGPEATPRYAKYLELE
jgi:hypothetical protein